MIAPSVTLLFTSLLYFEACEPLKQNYLFFAFISEHVYVYKIKKILKDTVDIDTILILYICMCTYIMQWECFIFVHACISYLYVSISCVWTEQLEWSHAWSLYCTHLWVGLTTGQCVCVCTGQCTTCVCEICSWKVSCDHKSPVLLLQHMENYNVVCCSDAPDTDRQHLARTDNAKDTQSEEGGCVRWSHPKKLFLNCWTEWLYWC